MTINAIQNHAVLDPQIYVAAVGAVAALFTRRVVTPVSDPKNKNADPLVVGVGITGKG